MAICADDLGEDVVGFGGPYERLGILVMQGDVFLDSGDQLGDAAKHPVAQALGRDVAKEALDHVEPGRRGRGEMQMIRGCLAIHSWTFGCLWVA